MSSPLNCADHLAIASEVSARLVKAANTICDELPCGPSVDRDREVSRVRDTLMRFQSNQFKFGDDNSCEASEVQPFSCTRALA